MKIGLYTSLIILVIICSQCTSKTIKISENEILWDNWGVPHIYSTNEANLYYSFAWAQMHSHGNLILKLYGEGRGKAAEYWGNDKLETDVMIQKFNLSQMAHLNFSSLSDRETAILQSFAEGINAYAKTHYESIPEELRVVLPIEPVDIISHTYRVFYLEFLIRRVIKQTPMWSAGSNAWVVGPSKSKSGNALLLANPHLKWGDFWMFYEAHLNLDNLNLYGATLVGLPFIGIGFNDYLGWTHTVNTLDNVDVYEITTENGRYLLDGQYLDIKEQTRLIRIKEDSVNYRVDTLVIKTTQHGIIVKEEGNKAIAVRFSRMEDPPNILQQWYKMGNSTSLETFENALKLNEIPLFNVLYADREGNILYHFGGHVPKKPFGDWQTWKGIVSGDESKNIWNSYHNYEELPRILNPGTGWLQNANDPPFTSTIPTVLDPNDFPAYLAPNSMGFRAQQSANLLIQDNEITFDEFIEYKHSTNAGLAERILDDFLPLKDQAKDSITIMAFEVLDSWDRRFEAESKGAVLFINWIDSFVGRNLREIFETDWSFDEPITTPDGIKDKESAIQALSEAAHTLIETYGMLAIEYGDVYRMRVGDYDLPANGGTGELGLFRTTRFYKDKDGKYNAIHGDGFVAAVEFGKEIKAKVLLSYGNATQPGSKHIGDQLPLYSKKQLRDALLNKKDVEMNIEFKESIKMD